MVPSTVNYYCNGRAQQDEWCHIMIHKSRGPPPYNAVVCKSNTTALLGEAAVFFPGYQCDSPAAPSHFDRLMSGYRVTQAAFVLLRDPNPVQHPSCQEFSKPISAKTRGAPTTKTENGGLRNISSRRFHRRVPLGRFRSITPVVGKIDTEIRPCGCAIHTLSYTESIMRCEGSTTPYNILTWKKN